MTQVHISTIARRACLVLLAVGSVGGCAGADDSAALGPLDENVAKTSAALTSGPFTLHNYQTGLCLGVAAGTPTIWTPMVTWTCDASANQTFTQGAHYSDNPAYIRIANSVAADRYIVSAWATDGSPVSIDAYYASDWQGWKPIYVGKDLTGHECYQFESKYAPGKVMGVLGGKRSTGAAVGVWSNFKDSYNHPDQYWCVY
jgi:hypothetical protein